MDAPPVQYVTTSDGLSIAYVDVGEGTPFVFTSNLWTHIQHYWTVTPAWREWLHALAANFRLVHFDWRGSGMSSRGLPQSFTMSDLELDLDAVLERLDLDRCVLYGIGSFAHVAIRYAAEHPERIVALIVQSSAVQPTAWPTAIYRTLHAQSWELFLRAQLPSGLTTEQAHEAAKRLGDSVLQQDVEIKSRAFMASSIEDVLPRLAVPTLVMHPREYIMPPAQEGMNLAARIPNARFVLIEGEDINGDQEMGIRVIQQFLYDKGLSDVRLPALPDHAAAPTAVVTAGGALSGRQAEVLGLIAAGKTNREIADELILSLRTVERHVTDIYDKLGVRNRAEAITVALRHQTTL